jgi:glycosyltransferase involved in cell wall biosynthesis
MWRPATGVIRDGGVRRSYEIISNLPSQLSITVIDRRPSPLQSTRRVVGYTVPTAISRLQSKNYWLSRIVEALLVMVQLARLGYREARRQPDAILYVPMAEHWWTSLPAYAIHRLCGLPLVLVPQNTLGRNLPSRLNWGAHARADQIIAISDAIQDELAELGLSRNVSKNGVGFRRQTKPSPVERHANTAVFVGRLEKGLSDHLRAWKIVVKEKPDAKLILVGHGTPRTEGDFRRLCAELRLGSSVELAGVLSDEDKWSILEASRVFLFLSSTEGWGIAPIEALSAGLPAVVYDLPCYKESLSGLDGVARVPTGDVEAAAREICKVLDMANNDFQRLSESIRSRFTYPTWDEVAERELGLIQATERELRSPLVR